MPRRECMVLLEDLHASIPTSKLRSRHRACNRAFAWSRVLEEHATREEGGKCYAWRVFVISILLLSLDVLFDSVSSHWVHDVC